MASDGLFFKSVARIHPKFQVPSNSILLQAVIAVILALSGSFEQVLTYMGFALGIFPVLTVLSVFKQRKINKETLKLPGFPVVQIVYMITGVMILFLSYLERPIESSIALAVVAIGVPAYFIFKKISLKGTS
jgi:APA family basic amino acid/polyamine antiporter